ncbi:hypothetical protein ACRYCC_32800 [Actinomadura scrupuli]|uniref:hypothetical protein n=1 Tax=Actinomadura scrupuli TaxID=559629 RepID=UPI003D9981E2
MILVTLGVITTLPVLALGWPKTLHAYAGLGVPSDPMTLALLQHRGVLQAALGASLVWGAFQPAVRIQTAVTAITTKSTFLILIANLPGPSKLDDVAGVPFDTVAIALLAIIVVISITQIRARRMTTTPAEAGPVSSPSRR